MSFLVCLSLLIAPFHISANGSLSAPFVGYNAYYFDYDTQVYIQDYSVDLDTENLKLTCSNMVNNGCMTYVQSGYEDVTGKITLRSGTSVNEDYLYRIDLILDADYIGYVNITAGNISKNYYVNGNIISFTILNNTSNTITINNYSLEKRNDNTLMWQFPIESFNIINQQFKSGYEVKEYFNNGNYIFPVFSVPSGSTIGQLWSGGSGIDMFFIFGINRNLQLSNYSNVLEITNANVTRIDELYFSDNMTIKKFFLTSTNTSGGFVSIKLKSAQYYMPIFFNTKGSQSKLSTDFALNYGMTNPLLDNIATITNNTNTMVNGTSSSNNSSSSLNDSTSQFTSSSNQLITQEDAFNDNMNNALQNINTNFDFNNAFGSKFLASANWVKTQYDRLTGSTPFGSVISFSLLLGLALLLVGKVLK